MAGSGSTDRWGRLAPSITDERIDPVKPLPPVPPMSPHAAIMRHPEPHENGVGLVYPEPWPFLLDQGRFVSGALSPHMSLAWTSCEPEPVASGPPGSTKSSMLHLSMSSRGERAWGACVMDIIFPCCAGLDVHKKTVVACIRRLGPEGQPDASDPRASRRNRSTPSAP